MKKAHYFSIALTIALLLIFPLKGSWALEETGGIGLTVGQLYDETTKDHKGYIVVLNVMKDGPAEKSGVEKGDIITHINGNMTKGRELMDFLKNEIRGPEGKEVTLKIWRYSQEKRIEIKIIRTLIFY
ncbi:MAG TPA: PDZ domain-containing protein [Thermodesulfobacteriota bacterium]|nr:PDZ domain-containing protein [Thermodesulfobacteriota bacterium]